MQVSAGPPDAKQCTVAVPRTRSLRCRAPSTLTLVARDTEGNTCTKGGARVEVTAKAVGSVQPGQVVDNGNGTYALNLELDVEGDWEITAMVRTSPPLHPFCRTGSIYIEHQVDPNVSGMRSQCLYGKPCIYHGPLLLLLIRWHPRSPLCHVLVTPANGTLLGYSSGVNWTVWVCRWRARQCQACLSRCTRPTTPSQQQSVRWQTALTPRLPSPPVPAHRSSSRHAPANPLIRVLLVSSSPIVNT